MDVCDLLYFVCIFGLHILPSVSVANPSDPADSRNGRELSELCYWDMFFEPRCESFEVLFIESAHFGRMRKGRCLTDDMGYIGCSADILFVMDGKCSGRHTCQVAMARLPRNVNSTCPNGVEKYLEVEYRCTKVAYPEKGYCDSSKIAHLPENQGYISSLVTQETGCGSVDNPWRITALPGQQVRLTLWNFSYLSDPSIPHSVDERCAPSVAITEGGAAKQLCASNARNSLLYTSHTHEVDIGLVVTGNRDQMGHFVLEYEAIGCVDHAAPDHGWMKRIADDVYLGCNETTDGVQQWQMHCNGTHWIGADFNCSQEIVTLMPVSEKSTTQRTLSKPNLLTTQGTLSIIVIAGLAVVVGLCVALSIMAVYIVRHRRPERPVREESNTLNYCTHKRRPPQTTRRSLMDDEEVCANATETDDYWTWQKQGRNPAVVNGMCQPTADGTMPLSGTLVSLESSQRPPPAESTLLVRNGGRDVRYNTGRGARDYDQLDPDCMDSDNNRADSNRDGVL